MAILGRIREKSFFLILIIALGLILFLIDPGKLMDYFGSGGGKQYVAKVNDEVVYVEDFARKVESQGRGQKGMQVVNRIFEQEVNNILRMEEYKKLGIRVEKDQMWELIKSQFVFNQNFQNEDGQLDEGKVREFIEERIKTNAVSWNQTEEQIAISGQNALYSAMLKAASLPTENEGALEYSMTNDLVDIKYVYLAYESIADSTITISKDQINSYVNANQQDFEEKENRTARYVYFEEKPSKEDEDAHKADVEKFVAELKALSGEDLISYVDENSEEAYDSIYKLVSVLDKPLQTEVDSMALGDVFGPYAVEGVTKIAKLTGTKMDPSVKASHILIAFEGATRANPEVKRTKEVAQQEAEKLLEEVKAAEADFAQFAQDHSDGPSKTKGGDLGWFNQGQMVKEFNDYVFANEKGSIGLVETEFGFHIIKIDDTKEEKKYQVAVIAKKVEPSQKTIDNIYTEASVFEVAALEGDFEKVAADKQYSMRPVNKITELAETLPGFGSVGSQRQVVRWLFDAETNTGDIRRFDLNGGYIVAQLMAKKAEGSESIEEASAIAIPELRKKEKAKQLMAKVNATKLADMAANQNTTVRTANAITMANPVIPGTGREPAVIGAAFGMKNGQVSQLIEGVKGVYMIEVTKHTKAPELDTYKSFAKPNPNNVNDVIRALKDKSRVEDYRSKFY